MVDFYDRLKSISKGYASFDYDFLEFRAVRPGQARHPAQRRPGGRAVASSSTATRPTRRARRSPRSCAAVIPRQLYEVAIQAAIGSRVIARETVKAMGKNVTAKCYGGDITRKRKLLEKQKEGKKRMKQVGKVEVPQEAFLSVLKS